MAFYLFEPEIAIWTIYLPKFYALSDSYSQFLNQKEKDIANRFIFPHLKLNYIITHGIIRELIASYLHRDPTQIEIKNTSLGKPFIENKFLKFNLSHSQDYAICAFSAEREVGIDIEYKQEDIVDDQLTESILSLTELEMYKKLSEPQKIESFFIQWTRKEAFLKALGTGLKWDLKLIDMPTQISEHFLNIEPSSLLSDQKWLLKTFPVCSNYTASLVCQSNSSLPELKFYNF